MANYNIFNPFTRTPEKVLLFTGIAGLLLAAWMAQYFNIIYDGVINIHATSSQTFSGAVGQNLIAVGVLFVILYLIGLSVNKRTRAVDILTAVLVFRIPLYLLAFTVPLTRPFLKKLPAIDQLEHFKPAPGDLVLFSVMGLAALVFLAYAFVLLVNGFKVAANSKKVIHIVFVVAGVIVADLIAKILITHIYLN